MPSSSNTSAFARRARRWAADPSRANSIRSRRDSLSRNPGPIMHSVESGSGRLARGDPDSHGVGVQGVAQKKFRWRRPRNTLKGRQIAAEVERVGLRLQLRKQQAEVGDIVLLYGDESEALTHGPSR